MISLRSGAAFALAAALLLVTVSLPLPTHAQTASPSSKPVVVATVNIYDAKILNQEGNTFTISFDLSNREGTQSGIRYAVELLDEQSTVDVTVYPDVTNLESSSHVLKNIRYTAPAYLSGTYQMGLVSENTNGLVLAHASLGTVTLSGTGSYVEILRPTCFLTVAGEAADKTYTLEQGVDVASTEELKLTCTLKNHSQTAVTLTPSFETFYRDVFGEKIATPIPAQETLSVAAGADATFSLTLPQASEPQAYDVKLSFTNSANVPSNSVTAHYVLRGASATVQNLRLDKASYTAGETALISIFWSGPASNFFNARSAPDTVSGVQAYLRIVGSGGSCGPDVMTTLDPKRSTQDIPFPVTGACDSPTVSIILADNDGNALASSSFDFRSSVSVEQAAGGNTLAYIVLALLVLALIYGIWRMFAKRPAGGAALIVVGLCIISYGLPDAARADTFVQDVYLVSSGGWQMSVPVYYDVNLNKAVFSPGETITAAGNVRSAACGNSMTGDITATINASTKYVYRSALVSGGPYHVEASVTSNTFSAQTAPGSYTAQFYPELHVPNWGPGAGSYFSVGGAGGGEGSGGDTLGGASGFGNKRGGGGMLRDWVGTTPYEMPYTVSGACTPTSRTCQPSGNLQDNCGSETVCPNGCSTATNQCNTSCVPGLRTCRANGNLQDNCGGETACANGCSTVTNQCNTSCVPGPRTCRGNGNLQDNCGGETACANGCSTSTNQCNSSCNPTTRTCNANSGVITDNCGNRTVCPSGCSVITNQCIVTSCPDGFTFQNGQCVRISCPDGWTASGNICIPPSSVEFEPFPAISWTDQPFAATGHLQAIPSLIREGETSRIYWNAINAVSCTVTGSNNDGKTGSPTGIWNTLFSGAPGKTTSAITSQVVYTLVCNARTGATPTTVRETVTVNVTPSFEEI